MIRRTSALLAWTMTLVAAPPPLESMSTLQKVGRIFLVLAVILVSCVLLAMVGATALFLFERGRRMLSGGPEMISGLQILAVGVAVNVGSVWLLFQVRKADRKLMDAAG